MNSDLIRENLLLREENRMLRNEIECELKPAIRTLSHSVEKLLKENRPPITEQDMKDGTGSFPKGRYWERSPWYMKYRGEFRRKRAFLGMYGPSYYWEYHR